MAVLFFFGCALACFNAGAFGIWWLTEHTHPNLFTVAIFIQLLALAVCGTWAFVNLGMDEL